MDLELQGKTALITGGSKGIGKAIAVALAEEGVDVAIAARSQDTLNEAAEEIRSATKRKVVAISADTTSWDDVKRMVETTVAELGSVDILVNSAAMVGGQVRGTIDEADEKDLIEDLDTKVVGLFQKHQGSRAPHACQKMWASHKYRWRLSAPVNDLRTSQCGGSPHDKDPVRPAWSRRHYLECGSPWPHAHRHDQRATRQSGSSAGRIARGGQTPRRGKNVAIRRVVAPEELAWLTAYLASPKAECITGEVIAGRWRSDGRRTPVNLLKTWKRRICHAYE